MANLLITQTCVRSCPYCFAKKHMDDNDRDGMMGWKDFIYLVDFLEASGDKHVSLLGGEPTLHPEFPDYIVYLLERGFSVNTFTSGIMNEKRLRRLERVLAGADPERLSFVVNINDPLKSNYSETERVKSFLEVFGHVSSPGYNMYRPKFEMGFLFDYVNTYGMRKHLRLGLTHPIAGKKNAYIRLGEIQEMVNTLLTYEEYFTRFGVKIGLDCGFPMCTYTDEQLGKLYKLTGGRLSFGCGPAVDIGPDMMVWCCFPLSDYHKKSIYDFDNMQELVNFYQEKQMNIRTEITGIFDECETCRLRMEGMCDGGCLAHQLNNFVNEAEVRMPEVYQV
jgi:radical SAM protein with 4Fe4S-binding SPASM domain